MFSGICTDEAMITFVPSGRDARKSTISSTLCFLTSLPETGEQVCPMRHKES